MDEKSMALANTFFVKLVKYQLSDSTMRLFVHAVKSAGKAEADEERRHNQPARLVMIEKNQET